MANKDIKIVYSEPAEYFPDEIRRKYMFGEFAESRELRQIKSVVIGHAVGDALGVPVEFSPRAKLDKNPVTDMMGFGAYDMPAGSWSDDTSMSLAALDVLSNGSDDLFAIMVNFTKWIEEGEYTPTGKVFDVGRTCLGAVVKFVKACNQANGDLVPQQGFDVTSCGLDDEYSNGNGSLMRIHPFVLMIYYNYNTHENWQDIIRRASSLTHAHERSQIACLIYSHVLFHLLHKPKKESVILGLKGAESQLRYFPEIIHYKRLFSSDFAKTPREEIRSTGYVVDTLEAALWCLLNTDGYEECVLKAVNLGGDADTVAAIVGGLAGALYGYDAIPEKWRDTLKKREYIEQMCERANDAWMKNPARC